MSTVYTLLPVGGDDNSLPSIDIAEQSMAYEITCWLPLSAREEYIEFENLTANEVLDVALRMINVVLYQHPELFPQVKERLSQLKF